MPERCRSRVVTVAAIIERDGLYLLVEEHRPGPEAQQSGRPPRPRRSPRQGVQREALEETARQFRRIGWWASTSRFQRPASGEDVTYVRFAFQRHGGRADPARALDGHRALWMTLEGCAPAAPPQLARPGATLHRGPHAAGVRLPLTAINTDASVYTPEIRAPDQAARSVACASHGQPSSWSCAQSRNRIAVARLPLTRSACRRRSGAGP